MAKKSARQVRARPQGTRQVRLKDYLWAALLSLALVWLVYLNFNIFRKEQIASQAAHETQEQLNTLQHRQNMLQSNIRELSTERGQEATMRETFGVAKPGEGVIIVVPTAPATTAPPLTFWQKWFGWLKF
jgi:cell division protein FtsB